MTKEQYKSLKEVIDYSIDSELEDLCIWMSENGYSDNDVEKFEEMNSDEQFEYLKSEKLTNHIYYHLLVLKTV